MTSPRVVCLDTVMIDFALIVDALPPRGGDALSSRRLVTAGGGFNLMSAARRQGVHAQYVGQLGVGRFADIARDILVREGIDIALPPRGELDLGVCVVLVDATGERTFVTSPGAELTIRAEDLDALAFARGDVVYVSGYNVVYPEVADTVSGWLAGLSREVRVAFDPGPRGADIDPAVLTRVLARTDWLLCNAAEARLLSGLSDVERGARSLLDHWGVERVVVRDGARGCVGVTKEGAIAAPGFATRVLDTNGAGDVHNGVVIAELIRGTPGEEALVRANAAAAIAISSFGPATCPGRAEVDALLQSQPHGVTRL
ncbi:MAG: sugar kinase [Acidobacteriota bacterium]|nr:sugar kinase [Acidobacteriota bacterium]